ncbi:type I restriction enzyme HsdR N-terminal domain-containing protein [Planobispora longispora]|uniref:type I restriction enzyme HsdR N-terminal domain-containing protein n=1 Tax=Planobispora longispora TaxID=28887 RepID=UPI001EF64470|nr:type I restriction enzyme HsdR N-terminal domain-containing protein [Planobispora longispora]
MTEQAAQAIVGDGQAINSPEASKGGGGSPVKNKKESGAKALPKWEADARDRVRTAVRRYSKPLVDLVARDANEGDTRLLITDFLCEGLGYDKYEDLTTEYQVKGEFADYGIRIDKQLVAFIEVKRCSQKLNAKHLRQVQMYAVNEGVEWMILSNGQVWQVYHMTAGLPVVIDMALEVDLLSDASLAAKTDALFYLTKEAFKRRLIDDLWRARAATSPKSLAQVLLSDVVVEAVRKEVRRQTSYNADVTEIHRILREEVLRSEILA